MSQWQLPPLSAWAPDIIAPHPNSWVAFIASTFRVVAYIILTPIILFTLTAGKDIAAYAVARTLGWSLDTDPQADPDAVQKPKEAPMTGSPEPKIEANPDQTAQDSGPAPPQIALPPSPPTFAADLRFTVPGEANYELSGMFSPPISRAGSPGLSRRMRSSSTSLSAAGSDSEGPGGEMRLGVGKLGMTPVDGSTLRAPDGVARRRPARRASES
ncbi:hypothetical protein FRC10_000882 [Ceratobasidium sp. 414]|nr:hypothetical protein FRC10_000882 [Ceratobasidium sp. 414]